MLLPFARMCKCAHAHCTPAAFLLLTEQPNNFHSFRGMLCQVGGGWDLRDPASEAGFRGPPDGSGQLLCVPGVQPSFSGLDLVLSSFSSLPSYFFIQSSEGQKESWSTCLINTKGRGLPCTGPVVRNLPVNAVDWVGPGWEDPHGPRAAGLTCPQLAGCVAWAPASQQEYPQPSEAHAPQLGSSTQLPQLENT